MLLLMRLASTDLDPFDIMLSYNARSGDDLPRGVWGYGEPWGPLGWTAVGITYSVWDVAVGKVARWCSDFSHGGEGPDEA